MKIFTGKVIHTKMQKTAAILVERQMAHPVYGKRVRKTKKYLVHDEIGTKAGDVVRFVAGRPISKLKRWKIIEVVGEKKQSDKASSKVLPRGGQKGDKKAQKKP